MPLYEGMRKVVDEGRSGEFIAIVTSAITGVMQPLIDKLDSKIDRLQSEHRIDYERLRAEIATSHYTKTEIDPHLIAFHKEIERARQDAARDVADVKKSVDDIQKGLDAERESKKTKGDRALGRIGGYVTVIVGVLTGLGILVAFLAQHWRP